jgi:hypothetical protein
MKQLKQELRFCNKCNHETLHYTKDGRINWLMHLVLILLTAGIWGIVLIFAILGKVGSISLTGTKGTCSKCGAHN